jgi:hypothetical protein
MEVIASKPLYQLSWQDAEHTVLILEIMAQWNWDDALEAIAIMNKMVSSVSHDVYSILHFKGKFILPEVRNFGPLRPMIAMDHVNERVIVLVNANMFVVKLMAMVSKAYSLEAAFGKYRFTHTIDDALRMIDNIRGIDSIA